MPIIGLSCSAARLSLPDSSPCLPNLSATVHRFRTLVRFGGIKAGVRIPVDAFSFYQPKLTSLETLAATIGRVAPRRHEQRHMEMAFGFADGKAQGYPVKERWIRQRNAATGEI